MAEQNPSGWVKGAAAVIGVVVPLLGSFLVLIRSADLDRIAELRDRLAVIEERISESALRKAAIERELARAMEHVEQHEKDSTSWKSRIVRNEANIHTLSTKPASRPDPFTGSEGRELERRVNALERCCEKRQF